MTKMTYADAINYALTVVDNDEVKEKLEALLVSLAKRNSKTGERKPTKTQVENDAYKATIVAYLTGADAPKCIKELQTEIAELAALTNQRITHMLTDLVKVGTLTKTYIKKTPYYSIAV